MSKYDKIKVGQYTIIQIEDIEAETGLGYRQAEGVSLLFLG